jgi:hypothetical protein
MDLPRDHEQPIQAPNRGRSDYRGDSAAESQVLKLCFSGIRPNGAATFQHRASPWDHRFPGKPCPERASHVWPLQGGIVARLPRAMPWAGMFRAFQAEYRKKLDFKKRSHQSTLSQETSKRNPGGERRFHQTQHLTVSPRLIAGRCPAPLATHSAYPPGFARSKTEAASRFRSLVSRPRPPTAADPRAELWPGR